MKIPSPPCSDAGRVKDEYFMLLSDTIGSIVKMGHTRGLKKHDIGIESVGDSVKIMRDNISSKTKTKT